MARAAAALEGFDLRAAGTGPVGEARAVDSEQVDVQRLGGGRSAAQADSASMRRLAVEATAASAPVGVSSTPVTIRFETACPPARCATG